MKELDKAWGELNAEQVLSKGSASALATMPLMEANGYVDDCLAKVGYDSTEINNMKKHNFIQLLGKCYLIERGDLSVECLIDHIK